MSARLPRAGARSVAPEATNARAGSAAADPAHSGNGRAPALGEACVVVPIRTVSELNVREHWAVRAQRSRKQQEAVAWTLRAALGEGARFVPCDVLLVRCAARRLDPDNLAASFKHVQDSVARWLGVDDGDAARVTWAYDQRHAKGWSVEIRISRRTA